MKPAAAGRLVMVKGVIKDAAWPQGSGLDGKRNIALALTHSHIEEIQRARGKACLCLPLFMFLICSG